MLCPTEMTMRGAWFGSCIEGRQREGKFLEALDLEGQQVVEQGKVPLSALLRQPLS